MTPISMISLQVACLSFLSGAPSHRLMASTHCCSSRESFAVLQRCNGVLLCGVRALCATARCLVRNASVDDGPKMVSLDE
jgi:hypothetical protein